MPPEVDDLAALASEAGIRRVHAFAWRDLDDVEAGGSELFVARVLEVWAAAGLDITLRTSMARGLAIEDARDGYRVVRRSGRFAVFPDAILREIARRNGAAPDAVVEAWNGVPFLSPLWFRGPRLTILHHVHRRMWGLVLPPGLARLGWLLEGRLAPPLYRSSPVVTNSSSSRQEIVEELGLPDRNVLVAPPGIDGRYQPDDAEPRAGHPLVVGVGRLMPHKHFDQLIRIAAEARRDVPDLELVIVGEGYERPNLEAVVEAVQGESWVRLVGRVSDDELRTYYRRAWVLAAMSIAEGFGMTLTEAAACGTPAVATRIAGHRDAVIDGESGLLGDDQRQLAGHLRAVLTDPDLRRRLSEGARKRAAALTWEATANQVFAPLAAQGLDRRARRR